MLGPVDDLVLEQARLLTDRACGGVHVYGFLAQIFSVAVHALGVVLFDEIARVLQH